MRRGTGLETQRWVASLAQRVKDADLIIALGVRLGEMSTGGYSLFTPPGPLQKLVHIHAGPEAPFGGKAGGSLTGWGAQAVSPR